LVSASKGNTLLTSVKFPGPACNQQTNQHFFWIY
jgi:hypothetical protein